LLIAHKHDIEHILTNMFRQNDPNTVGNEYLIFGTVEKTSWRKGLNESQTTTEALSHASDFTEYYNELRMTCPGWYPAGKEPPIMNPAPSLEWVKSFPNCEGSVRENSGLPGVNKT